MSWQVIHLGKFPAVVLLLLMLAALLPVPSPLAEVAYALDGTTAALTEWPIPTAGSQPTGLALDPSGNCCWFVESAGNKVAHLDPSTNTFREWVIPTPGSYPTSLGLTTISGSLAVFGTESAKNKVFLFFPSTGTYKEYDLPTKDSGPQRISVEAEGTKIKAWFTELGRPSNGYGRNAIGEFTYDSGSGTAKLYELTLPPSAGGGANDVHASSGAIWFAGRSAIIKWDTDSSRFTTWAVPAHPSTQGAFVDVDALGQVWYISRSTGVTSSTDYVGVLKANNTFTEWQIPTSAADAQGIAISPVTRRPWVAEHGADKVADLDPSSGGITTSTQPAVRKSDPARGVMLTIVTGPVLPATAKVAPEASTAHGSTTEQFTEWMLPTGSHPQDPVVDTSGNVWVLESSANKVARLSLSPDFRLACEPSSLNIVQYASGISTCTVTSIYGFSSPVGLSGIWVGTEPTGVAYTIPSPVTPAPDGTSSSTLTIVAAATASTGTFTFQVVGTSGPLTHSVNLTVTIATGAVDFTITASPQSLSVAPGTSADTTVTIQSVGVFSSSVYLTTSGAPNGMTLLFGTNPVTPPIGGTVPSTLTVRVSGAPQGTHAITVTGTGGLLTHGTVLTVQVIGGPCLIATATYGSELSDEVQFLRTFRDNSILETSTGSNFMIAFNAWYYSFSPTVAEFIREHSTVRTAARVMLYPLIGVLKVGEAAFHLFPTNPEVGAVVSGLVVSSLIGVVYFSIPVTALLAYSPRVRRIAKRLETSASAVLLGALAALPFITAIGAPAALMIATSIIVLTTLAVSALVASQAILRVARPR